MAKTYQDWPNFSGTWKTARAFRDDKRKKMRAALRALEDFREGCAYTPAYDEFKCAVTCVEKAIDLLSSKNWKR